MTGPRLLLAGTDLREAGAHVRAEIPGASALVQLRTILGEPVGTLVERDERTTAAVARRLSARTGGLVLAEGEPCRLWLCGVAAGDGRVSGSFETVVKRLTGEVEVAPDGHGGPVTIADDGDERPALAIAAFGPADADAAELPAGQWLARTTPVAAIPYLTARWPQPPGPAIGGLAKRLRCFAVGLEVGPGESFSFTLRNRDGEPEVGTSSSGDELLELLSAFTVTLGEWPGILRWPPTHDVPAHQPVDGHVSRGAQAQYSLKKTQPEPFQ